MSAPYIRLAHLELYAKSKSSPSSPRCLLISVELGIFPSHRGFFHGGKRPWFLYLVVVSRSAKAEKETPAQPRTKTPRLSKFCTDMKLNLRKNLHFKALQEELLLRGCTDDELIGMTIRPMGNKLKALEIARVVCSSEKEAASKAFKPFSPAVFAKA
jgi:hypothetical protein